MAPAMLLLLSILLGLCLEYAPSQQCNCNGSKQELAKKVAAGSSTSLLCISYV